MQGKERTSEQQVDIIYRLRVERKQHPMGEFVRNGTWYPSEKESCECCRFIRSPSRAYPYSLLTHCRTRKHIANLIAKQEGEI